jgi:four helix bundle protein
MTIPDFKGPSFLLSFQTSLAWSHQRSAVSMKDFRELKVWARAHHLVLTVYKATSSFPNQERYGLTSQTRRASVSIAANIAEGCGRGSDADFGRFLQMAMGSASEVEYLLLLAQDLGYLAVGTHGDLEAQTTEVKRMLTGLIRHLKADR